MKDLMNFIQSNVDSIVDLAIEICRVPSPTGSESEKCRLIQGILRDYEIDGVSEDDAGNVIVAYNPYDAAKYLVLAAHVDTVFNDVAEINPTFSKNRLCAPSIHDNSINIAALLFIVKATHMLRLKFGYGVLFVFDVGEEGLGNLRGIKEILRVWEEKIHAIIAVDGGYDKINVDAVGVSRYSVTVTSSGGHSWGDFGKENAIAICAEIICELYRIIAPTDPRTTYNVGTIAGGTTVNSIAGSANMLIEFRSEDAGCLGQMENTFRTILKNAEREDVSTALESVGNRPAGNIDRNSDLFRIIVDVRRAMEMADNYCAGSSDINVPLSRGIPAVSFGVCKGGNVHSTDEFLEVDSLETGLNHLVRILGKYLS